MGGMLEYLRRRLIADRYRQPRLWVNREVRRFAPMFDGKVANVSAWRDEDKDGGHYRDYFTQAGEYWITNYKSDARGFQGDLPNELFLDLSQPLAPELDGRFDAVLNMSALEHIFDVNTAFSNLCRLSRDIVLVNVPFLHWQHEAYGDYWRFTPLTVRELFRRNGMQMLYINYNDFPGEAVHLFAIGSHAPQKWESIAQMPGNQADVIDHVFIGQKVFGNSPVARILNRVRRLLKKSPQA